MPPGAAVADQADAYAALLDHLQLDRVVLCGFSAGGPAAIQFALRHPERLYGLVLGSSYLPGMGARTVPEWLLPLVRTVVQAAVDRVPGARLVSIDAGGHLFLQHASQVREATASFIAEVTNGCRGPAEARLDNGRASSASSGRLLRGSSTSR